MNALVGTFKQEKALVGAFSVIVKTGCGTDRSSAALILTFPVQTAGSRQPHVKTAIMTADGLRCESNYPLPDPSTRCGYTLFMFILTANCNFIQCRIIARQWFILSGCSIGYMHMNMRLFRNVSLTSFVA